MSISYFNSLLGLLRDRVDNPLARATLPWRGPRRRRAAFVGLLAAVTAGSLAGGWFARAHSASWGHQHAYHAAFAAIPLLTALALQMFGFRHRGDQALEDLALTRLTREEVAFGAVQGGVVAGGLFCLPVLAGYAVASVGAAEEFVYRLYMLLFLWVVSVGAAVRSWILAFGRVMHLFLYTGAFAVGMFLLAGMDQIFPDWRLGILLAAAMVSIVLVRQAGRFAGLRFFAPLDWEALCRAYWLTNELVAFSEFEECKAAMRELRRKNGGGFTAVVFGWVAGAAVLLDLLTDVHAARTYQTFFTPLPPLSWLWMGGAFPFLMGALVAALVSMIARPGIRNGDGWVAAGSIHMSVAGAIAPSVLPFVLPMICGGVVSHGQGGAFSPGWWMVAALLAAFLPGWALLASIRTRHFRMSFGVLAFLCLILFAYWRSVFPPDIGSYGKALSSFAFLAEMGNRALSRTGFIVLGLVMFWPSLCQSLHSRHLADVPRHTLVRAGRAHE